MNEKAHVLQQLEYHSWANRKVAEHIDGLSETVYGKQVTSIFPTIYEAMAHIYIIDRGWLAFLQRGGVNEMSPAYLTELQASIAAVQAEVDGKSMAQLGGMMEHIAQELRSYIGQLDDVAERLPSGGYQGRIADYIQHLVHHGVYHRGNVAAMLHQLGHTGTPTDYGFYLYTLHA